MTAPLMRVNADGAYRESTTRPLSEIAHTLQEILSRRLTAVIAGVKDGKTVARWAAGETAGIRDISVERRLRTAYQIVVMLWEAGDAPQTIKAWFIGLNPQLGDVSPAEAVREDRLQEVLAAARAFVAGG